MNNPIGVLDSGVGGLSIWQEIVQQLPHESTVYIADSKYCPYGNREKAEICALATRLIEFLVTQEVKLIVVACNTITVSCLDVLREQFKDVPLVGIVPVVKSAAEATRNKKIGILSTIRTAESQYQKDLIQKFAHDCEVVNIGTDKLVPLVERGIVSGPEVEIVLQEVLQPFKEKEVDTLALGCSHYPFLKAEMQKILGENVQILDSAGAISRQVERVLAQENLLSEKSSAQHTLYTTGDTERVEQILNSMGYSTLGVEKIEL